MFTNLIKHESDTCRDCDRASEGYFGNPYIRTRVFRGNSIREAHVYSLCKVCFQTDSACAEAEQNEVRFTAIGVGIYGISSPLGDRCCCGAVTHARLNMCIQCSKDNRMLTKIQAEKKFIDKLLKDLRAEIKSKAKEIENAN